MGKTIPTYSIEAELSFLIPGLSYRCQGMDESMYPFVPRYIPPRFTAVCQMCLWTRFSIKLASHLLRLVLKSQSKEPLTGFPVRNLWLMALPPSGS